MVHKKENITTHSTDTLASIKHKHEEVKTLLLSGLETMYQKNIPYYAIVHLYLKCTGMNQDFIFSASGAERKTLKQLLHGEDLDIIIDRFAQMIQSGRKVLLDNNTKLTMYAFIPPTQFR